MRLSQLFFASLRDDPAEAEMASATGCCCAPATSASWAPASTRCCRSASACSKRIEQVIREEMDAIGGQEMEMPVVHPAELWKEIGPLRQDRP